MGGTVEQTRRRNRHRGYDTRNQLSTDEGIPVSVSDDRRVRPQGVSPVGDPLRLDGLGCAMAVVVTAFVVAVL
jgi:hypothetical protein